MSNQSKLPVREDLDFHYLLSLMPPLHDQPEFAWLPELFSIIGYESLITLCKYAGGETIRIPTLEELTKSIEALQWFYNVRISKTSKLSEVPANVSDLFRKIEVTYNARNSESLHS